MPCETTDSTTIKISSTTPTHEPIGIAKRSQLSTIYAEITERNYQRPSDIE